MTQDKNTAAITSTLANVKTRLDDTMHEVQSLIDTEVEKQTAKIRDKLLDALEDPEKLSEKDLRDKKKRDNVMVATATVAGALLGAMVFFPPVTALIAGYMAASVGMAVTSAVGAVLAAVPTAALGYGIGHAQARLTPYSPTLSREQLRDIQDKAKETVETDAVAKVLCQLRLERTEGKIGYQELAEICEALSDIATLKYKMSESSTQKLKESAQEARTLLKEEEVRLLEKEKLKLEEKKSEKLEAKEQRTEEREDKKMEHEMNIGTLMATAKIQRAPDGNAMNKIVTKLLGGSGGDKSAPIDLPQLAMLQMLSRKNGSTGGRSQAA